VEAVTPASLMGHAARRSRAARVRDGSRTNRLAYPIQVTPLLAIARANPLVDSYPMRRHLPSIALLPFVALLLVSSTTKARRDPALLASMDSILLETDFAGVVRVTRVDHLGGDRHHIFLSVVDPWVARWGQRASVDFVIIERRGEFARLVNGTGESFVVLLSGGPYEESPFTFRGRSVFALRGETAMCSSGNPLFAIDSSGFHCSVQSMQAMPPSPVAELREQFRSAHTLAVRRAPELNGLLSGPARALHREPSTNVDRTLPGQEILR
jgi:hypothetical protein